MSSPAYHVAQYLDSQGIGSLDSGDDWRLFVGAEPVDNAPSITIYDTGGGESNADGPYYANTVQARIRCASYMDGYNKAIDVRNALVVPTSKEIGVWLYTGFWVVSDIAKIGRDDANREIFTINFRTMREELPTA